MNPPSSSRSRYRIIFGLWCLLGIGLIAASYSVFARKLERNQKAATAVAAAREALEAVRKAGPAVTADQLKQAAERAAESINLLEGTQNPGLLMQAKVEAALVDLESGRAFEALNALSLLADEDRPRQDSPWTSSTPVIENAIAETRYKIAVMCLDEGDGYQMWTKFAEAAARSYQELADHSATPEEKDRHLKNLAICTRLIHGGNDVSHTLGFPARRTIDCVKVARKWVRPQPNPKDKPKDDPNPEPPEPNESTEGR